jgi:hypothetical protein
MVTAESIFNGERPEYVVRVKPYELQVRATDALDDERIVKLNVRTVLRDYAHEARSMSGCRSIDGLIGDWRPIDNLASIGLEYLKIMCPAALRREAKKYGMTAKF